MTLKNTIKFNDIKRETFEILNKNPNISSMAMEYLHPRNTHPESLRIYNGILNKNNIFFNLFKHVSQTLTLLILSIIRKEKFFFGNKIAKNVDILFISHLTNINQLSDKNDFYYGSLIYDLVKKTKLKPLVALINHTWIQEKNIKESFNNSNYNKIILSRTVNFFIEFKHILMLLREGINLKNNIKNGYKKRTISNHNCFNAISMSSLMAMRTYYQIKKILEEKKPKYLIITYEGHAWERLAFYAAKSINKNIQCIGYQHSVLFPNQNAIFRNLNENFNPDIIFTPGKISYEWFKNEKISTFSKIYVLGSPRSHKLEKENKISYKNNSILFLPEGIQSETELIFKTALFVAKTYPQRNIVFRLHPVLNNKKYKQKLLNRIKPLSNIVLSKDTLQDDIFNSSIAVYRGSSTIVTAILNGLYPIYLSKNKDFKTIDPLFMINKKDRIALSDEDLIRKVILFEKLKISNKHKIIKNLQMYCRDYFQPLCFSNFLRVVQREANLKEIQDV